MTRDTMSLSRFVSAFATRSLVAPTPFTRPFATVNHADFTSRFLDVVRQDLPSATDPGQSSALLRRLVQSGLLRFTDMRDEPEKFFLAHRLLSSVGLNGFGVRFTVQFNLFAGSIVGLGGADQVSLLDDFQRDGTLGCFLLTEMQAGGEGSKTVSTCHSSIYHYS